MYVAATALAILATMQGSAGGVRPSDPAPLEVKAVRLQQQVTLDGVLSETAWQRAVAFSRFVQRDPHEGELPSERTVVYVLYDDEALYVGAHLYDAHPDSIIARLARRDRSVTADMFGVYLDPYHDGRTGVYFAVNAAGTLYDGTLYNDDWDDDSWDGVWEAAARIGTDGWTVEMRIPYSQLRFRQRPSQIWGINFRRDIARLNEADFLVYTPKNGSGFVSRFPELVGMQDLHPPRHLEVMPYVTSRTELRDHAPGNPFNDGSRFDGGIGADLRVGLGSNLTLDGTINPDFGQVEVDPAVVNLSDFETFFPEKRPFFVEGSNIFDFGYGGANNNWGFNFGTPDFFYSRRIGRAPQGSLPDNDYSNVPQGTTILGAAKLTGKVAGSWNFGMLHALTGREMAQVDIGGQESRLEVEPRTYYGLTRMQRDFNDGRQGIGFISTIAARDFSDPRLRDQINSNALAGGIDGWTFLDHDKVWVITGWAGATRVAGDAARMTDLQQSSLHYFQRPDAGYLRLDSTRTSLAGFGARIALNKQKGDWRINTALGTISPGFELNDLGFQWQSDVVNGHFVVGRRWSQPGRIFRSANLNTAVFRSWDYGGDVTWSGLWHSGYLQFLNYYSLRYYGAWNPQTVSFRRTRGGPLSLNPSGWEGGFSLSSDDRKAVVFGAGLDLSRYQQESDRSWSVSTSVEWKPTSSLSLSFEPEFSRSFTAAQYVGTFADPTATATYGHRYVFAALQQTSLSGNLRLNWIFNPKLSLELFAQPLLATGDYYHFGELSRPRSYDFTRYGRDGGSTFDAASYVADPDGPGGPAQPIEIGNPDFSFGSLRGNAVLRWEYMPGSTLYLVWTQSRSNNETLGDFRLGHSLHQLWSAKADNIFAVKVSYYWTP